MAPSTDAFTKKLPSHAAFRLLSLALYSLGLFSLLALTISAATSFAIKAYSPLFYEPIWYPLLSLAIILAIWFYRVLRRKPLNPTINWYWPTFLIALCIASSIQAIYSLQYSTPLILAHHWPTTLTLTGIIGINLTCLLAIPWSIIDARFQEQDYSNPKAKEDSDTPNSWQRPALGAAISALTLAVSYAIIAVPTHPVISHLSAETFDTTSSSQPAEGMRSLNGKIAWSISKPSSRYYIDLFPGAAGPIMVHSGTQGYAHGLSEKDGSVLWEWKLSPTSGSEIDDWGTTSSPDGRYLAISIKHAVGKSGYAYDYQQRVAIIDAITGKELWNRNIRALDFLMGDIILTNRVVAIGQKVYDLRTGNLLWQIPDTTAPIAGIRASETLLTTPIGEDETPSRAPYLNKNIHASCSDCLSGSFTPVDDRTGKPKGATLTNILAGNGDNVAASRGWVLFHNEERGSNTLRNIDTGKEIPAPTGKPHLVREGQPRTLGQETLLLRLESADKAQSDEESVDAYYLFSHTFTQPILIPDPLENSTLIPQKGDSALWAGIVRGRPLLTVRVAEFNNDQPLVDVVMPDLPLRYQDQIERINQIIPTREGILIHVGGTEISIHPQRPPSQLIMIK
ncbi:MAG: PQQ-binding-like beta-propeller repeat protein [Actinomycetaceae bacterium]|nr:PQQ-binding-like beta-propeller repeat protein [Actinomycetaceae bacterium]